jgi:hypothetical protein
MISSQYDKRRFRLGTSVNNADLSLHGKRQKKKKTESGQEEIPTQFYKIFLQVKAIIDKTTRELFF